MQGHRKTAGMKRLSTEGSDMRRLMREVKCDVCGRCFRRECDKAWKKCTAERKRPVHEQML